MSDRLCAVSLAMAFFGNRQIINKAILIEDRSLSVNFPLSKKVLDMLNSGELGYFRIDRAQVRNGHRMNAVVTCQPGEICQFIGGYR